jgi:hypothetical protein
VLIDIDIWCPNIFSEGKWRVTVTQDQFRAIGDHQSNQGTPIISSLDRSAIREIVPASSGVRFLSNLNVTGWNFAPNTPVYILLYKKLPKAGVPLEFKLTRKQVVGSDAYGAIAAKLLGPLEPGEYLLYGITDFRTALGGILVPGYCNDAPCDRFSLTGSTPAAKPANSCPGAPPQRMTVNQHGYVCTKSDSVRLRVSPARSASTLVQIVPGTQFTVIGGPSCSDNWSWWNIRLDDGTIGWVSEGGDDVDPYFICPLP